mgnify:CR=1 FL=1
MAIELKKYEPQVKISGAAAGVKGNVQAAGTPMLAIAKAAESMGSSINKVYEQKAKLEAQEQKILAKKTMETGVLKVQQDATDARLGQNEYRPVEEGGKGRVDFKDLQEKVIAPSIKANIEDKLKELNIPGIIRNDVQSMYETTVDNFTKNLVIEDLERQTQQSIFTLTEDIGDLASAIDAYETGREGDDKTLYGTANDPRLNADGTEPKDFQDYKANLAALEEDMEILRNVGKPGDAETALSVALYNRGIEDITLLKEKLRTFEITTEEFDEQASRLLQKINTSDRMLNKHQAAVTSQINFALSDARAKITKEYNDKLSSTAADIFGNNITSEDLFIVTQQLPPIYGEFLEKIALAEIGTQVSTTDEAGLRQSFEMLLAFDKGQMYDDEFVTIPRLGEVISTIQNNNTRELMTYLAGEMFKDKAETDPEGAWKALGVAMPQNVELQGNASLFIKQLGQYIQLFNVPGSTQSREQEGEFLVKNVKAFKNFFSSLNPETGLGRYGKEELTYEQFQDKIFADNAIEAVTFLANRKISYSEMTGTDLIEAGLRTGMITSEGVRIAGLEDEVITTIGEPPGDDLDAAVSAVGDDFMKTYNENQEEIIRRYMEANPGMTRKQAIGAANQDYPGMF